MNFGWGRAALIAAVMLAGCGQAQPMDPNAGKAEAAAFMAKTAKEEGVQRLHPRFLGPPCGQERLLRGETGQLQNICQDEEQSRGNSHAEKEQ